MDKEMMIQALVDSAVKDMQALKDPYQRGSLALEIAKVLHQTSAVVTDMIDTPVEKKPVNVSSTKAEAPVVAKTPEDKEIDEILSKPSRAEEDNPAPTKSVLENTPKLHDLNPEAPIADKLTEAVTDAAPEPKKASIDINSPEWQNKHLTAEELDKTWTPAMKANKELMESALRLRKICTKGIESGFIKEDWLNARIQEASSKHFMTYKDRNVFSPQVVRLIEGYVSGKVNELVAKAKAAKNHPAA